MKAKVPKSFSLAGLEWTITHGEVPSEGNLGHCDFFEQEIIVKSKYNGKKINQQTQAHTFYHELVHALLMSMGQHELNQNEEFVDLLGNFLYQFSKTAKWN